METLAERIIRYNLALRFQGALPAGIRIMNPFEESPDAVKASSRFYRQFYSDTNERLLFLGINPGRFGAGLTGVPFTDPKRLREICGAEAWPGAAAHEPSSVFIYAMIDRYGGPERFYRTVYINSICPLGFVAANKKGKEVNYNYYDSKELSAATNEFIIENLSRALEIGIRRDVCICLGTGRNRQFLEKINKEHKFFGKIIALEHPRYIIQYKAKSIDQYIDKYVTTLRNLDQGG